MLTRRPKVSNEKKIIKEKKVSLTRKIDVHGNLRRDSEIENYRFKSIYQENIKSCILLVKWQAMNIQVYLLTKCSNLKVCEENHSWETLQLKVKKLILIIEDTTRLDIFGPNSYVLSKTQKSSFSNLFLKYVLFSLAYLLVLCLS